MSQILVVEDESIVAMDIANALEGLDYSVLPVAVTGEEAVRRAEESRPDLVLMDIRLRGAMDGVEAAERIRSRLDIPVVYLTANADPGTLERAKLSGPFGYMIKPFEREELRTSVELALYKHQTEKKLRESERLLAAANAGLERRVRERTEELSRANRELTREIENHRRTENMLRESEAKFRSIAESAHDGIVLAEPDGRVVYMNKAARTMFGAFEEAAAGQPLRALAAERHRAALDDALAQLAAGRPGRTVELQGRSASGQEFPMEISLAAWRAGEKRFFAGIARDISGRKTAESNLKFQANILSQVNDAVVAMDRDGRIVYWNMAAERLYGRKLVEVIGRPWEEVIRVRWKRVEDEAAFRDGLRDHGSWRGEAPHLAASDEAGGDGRELQVEAAWTTLKDDEGQGIGRLAVMRDVTDRRHFEEALVHSEKLAAMGQMAAGVAHELKNPLAVILAAVDELPAAPAGGPDPVETIRRHVGRCATLVDSLLEFSRKERNSPQEVIDVNEAAGAALSLIEPKAKDGGITVERDLAPGRLTVSGRRDMVEQVVVNLALNAVDAMPGGGRLTLSTRVVKEGAQPEARLEVRDTGVGIPAALRRRIFEPFFTTKAPGKGTGLGLWLVQMIVANHGGRIDCASEEGKGSLFSVTLPLLEP